MPIIVNLDVMLAKRKMSVTELSEKVGDNNVKYIYIEEWKSKGHTIFNSRKICEVLDCQPG